MVGYCGMLAYEWQETSVTGWSKRTATVVKREDEVLWKVSQRVEDEMQW